MTEATTAYCGICGHPKEHHDLQVHLDPKKGHAKTREAGERGTGACRDNSYGGHRCICVEYQSWT
jgi:hypothetical protein